MQPLHRLITTLLLLGLLLPGLSSSRPMSLEQVPEPLRPWTGWVLWEHRDLDCPMPYNSAQRRCVWPGLLHLELDERGGHFSQQLTVYRETSLAIPGDTSYWPEQVTADGQPALIIDRQGRPQLWLPPGKHRIEGRFTWQRPPESLPIPAASGLISLSVNGQERPFPEFTGGRLWLRERHKQASSAPQDQIHLSVFREILDGHPMGLTTLLKLDVSGRQREVLLGKPLLPGFIPQQIDSPLPARLESDGRLRVQLRPGRWELKIKAVHPAYLSELGLPKQPPPWPPEEIWSFQAQPALRLVEVSGPPQIDPHQTRLPPAWRNLPAYRMDSSRNLRLKVIRRGDPRPEPDKLRLQRDLWLDFDGQGYTLKDQISGRMTAGWRLSVDPELHLGRVSLDGQPQYITRLERESRAGVEVRLGRIELLAESRIDGPRRDLPASGWGRPFQQVSANLHLPPGWRLLATAGVDQEHASWLQRWTLYDLFLVFVIAAAAGRLWGWRWALPILLGLALIWHEPGAPRYVWLYLLACSALLRVLPEGGYRRTTRWARALGLLALLAIGLPFMVDQARTALYPQLARPGPVNPPVASVFSPEDRLSALSQSRQVEALPPKASASLGSAAPRKGRPAPRRWQSDPNAIIQTGPGLPSWHWQRIPLTWNGPVAPGQRISLTLAGPRLNLGLNLLRILLLLLLAWRFVGGRGLPRLPPARGAATSALLLLSGLWLTGGAGSARADYPPQSLLDELEQRLTLPPECLPQCADIQRLSLKLTEARLSARLEVHALQATSIPLPIDTQQQAPLEVLLDQRPSNLLARDKAGRLWIQLPAGRHQILFRARLPKRERLQIPLPLRPHRVEVDAPLWRVAGLDENLLPDQQLQLTRKPHRRAGKVPSGQPLQALPLPPFVRVERTLHLGLEWSVETQVVRLSPPGVPILLHIPLLAGESVTSEGVRVADGQVLVNMAPDARQTAWRSHLPMGERIELTAPHGDQWLEQWRLDLGPQWHARISGIAPTHHQDRDRWLPTWQPWPGESVGLQLSRPRGIEGPTRTIDHSRLILSPGQRASDAKLTFRLRSSQGGRHELGLPAGARLLSVQIDQRSQPIRLEAGRLSLPVHPGLQTYQIEWRQDRGMQGHWRTPPVDLGLRSVNSEIQVHPGQGRWLLFTSGPKLGPAVLFWGELLVILLLALLLGRLKGHLPLGATSWLLLGIGLSQVSIWAALLVAGTLFAFGYRRRIEPQQIAGGFNLLQFALVILSLLTLATLFWAVQQGLLGHPQMQISGNGSSTYQLNWYQDRSPSRLPQAGIYSVPLWVYRLLMLAWALWLAFSLLGWVQWAWSAYSRGGRWIEIKVRLPRRPGIRKETPKSS